MIKIAIVDDEEQTREQILRTLKENIQEQYEVEIKLYASGESFFEEIQKGETADILFTDIQMQQLDGVELGKLVRRLCPDMYIVFITSYEEYAAESYRIEAYQYILKRDMKERLPAVLQKIYQEKQKESQNFFWIGGVTDQRKLYHKDIICIRKVKGQKYVEFVMVNGAYKERLALHQIFEDLKSPAFIFAGRSYIINIDHVDRITTAAIYLEDGIKIQAGAETIQDVKTQIMEYWRNVE
jgi:DNA-binding LytR/AlgR family response regulator